MKRYEYVTVDMQGFIAISPSNYRSVIDDYARRGYRYVGFVPTSIVGYGKIAQIDLIFETEDRDYHYDVD